MEALQIITNAIAHIISNKVEWIKVALAPMAIYAAFQNLLIFSPFYMQQMGHDDVTFIMSILVFLAEIAGLIFLAMAWTQLYRFAVLGEKATSWINIHFNKYLLRFMGYSLLFLVIIALIGAILGLPIYGLHLIHQSVLVSAILGAVMMVAMIYSMTRMILLFPAAATGNESPVTTTFYMLQGNVLMAFIVMLVFTVLVGDIEIPLYFATMAVSAFIASNAILFITFLFLMIMILAIFHSILLVAGISELYKHLLEKAK